MGPILDAGPCRAALVCAPSAGSASPRERGTPRIADAAQATHVRGLAPNPLLQQYSQTLECGVPQLPWLGCGAA